MKFHDRSYGGSYNEEEEEEVEVDDDDDEDGVKPMTHLKYNLSYVNDYFMFEEIKRMDFRVDASKSTVASLSFSAPGVCDPDQYALMTELMDKKLAEITVAKSKENPVVDLENAHKLLKFVRDNHLPRCNRSAPFMNIHDRNFGICEIRYRIASICASAFQLEQFIDVGKKIDFYSDYARDAGTKKLDPSKRIDVDVDLFAPIGPTVVFATPIDGYITATELENRFRLSETTIKNDILKNYLEVMDVIATDPIDYKGFSNGFSNDLSCEHYDSTNITFKRDVATDWWTYLRARELHETSQGPTIEHDLILDPFLSEQARAFIRPMTEQQRKAFAGKQATYYDGLKDMLLLDIAREQRWGQQMNPSVSSTHTNICSIRPNTVDISELYDRCWQRLYSRLFRIDAFSVEEGYPENMFFNGISQKATTSVHAFKKIDCRNKDNKTPIDDAPPAGFLPLGAERVINKDDMEVTLLQAICTDRMTTDTAMMMLTEFEAAWKRGVTKWTYDKRMDKVRKNDDWTSLSNMPFIRVVPDMLQPLMFKIYAYLDSRQRSGSTELTKMKKTLVNLRKRFEQAMVSYAKSTIPQDLTATDTNNKKTIIFRDEDIERVFKGEVSLLNFRTIITDKNVKSSVMTILSFFSSGNSRDWMSAYHMEMNMYMSRIVSNISATYLGLFVTTIELAKRECLGMMNSYSQFFRLYIANKSSFRYASNQEEFCRSNVNYRTMRYIFANYRNKSSDQLRNGTQKVMEHMRITKDIAKHLSSCVAYKQKANEYMNKMLMDSSNIQKRTNYIVGLMYRRVMNMENIVKESTKMTRNRRNKPPFEMIVFVLKTLYYFNEDFGFVEDSMGSVKRNLLGNSFGRKIKFNISKLDQSKAEQMYETPPLTAAEYTSMAPFNS
jgi:hypothetical protein